MRVQSFSMIPALPVKPVPDADDQSSDLFLIQTEQKVQGTLRAQELFQDRKQILFCHSISPIKNSPGFLPCPDGGNMLSFFVRHDGVAQIHEVVKGSHGMVVATASDKQGHEKRLFHIGLSHPIEKTIRPTPGDIETAVRF